LRGCSFLIANHKSENVGWSFFFKTRSSSSSKIGLEPWQLVWPAEQGRPRTANAASVQQPRRASSVCSPVSSSPSTSSGRCWWRSVMASASASSRKRGAAASAPRIVTASAAKQAR
jgi:hypothetical protein